MIALAVTTDGRREYLERAVNSLRAQLRPWPHRKVMVDDSGDVDQARWLARRYLTFIHRAHPTRQGCAATIEDAWRLAIRSPFVKYVFHAEDDFVYTQPIDLTRMAAILNLNPTLAQVALKRQPVNDLERGAGGFMQTRPAETWQQRDGWIEHQLNFTANPSLIPRHAIEVALADDRPKTEPNITETLLAANYTFGYLGRVEDPPVVEHIGEIRMPAWAE